MTMDPPRLRMFAGPNGSGKTTVKNGLQRRPEWFGVYINPDDIETELRLTGTLSLGPYGVALRTEDVRSYFLSSQFLQSRHLDSAAAHIEVRGDFVDLSGVVMNSYYASVLADLLRRRMLESGQSFSFETVMSAVDKIDLLRMSQARGFRTYLYYVATEDVAINIQRVKHRVAEGGHDVPEAKIVSRYNRSLRLLREAIPHTSRAYFFDTSEELCWYFAESHMGRSIELKTSAMPNWFQPIWDNF